MGFGDHQRNTDIVPLPHRSASPLRWSSRLRKMETTPSIPSRTARRLLPTVPNGTPAAAATLSSTPSSVPMKMNLRIRRRQTLSMGFLMR